MAARTALVVEDDKSIQSLLREALEAEGFQVICEKDGEWALRALERRLPNLLITDVLLPSLSGFDLIEALREMPGGKSVPVVVVSGIYRGARHHTTARENLGVRGYLDKPFELSRLVALLRDILGRDYPGASRRRARLTDEIVSAEDPLADVAQAKERDEVESQSKAFRGGKLARGNLRHKPLPEVLSQLYRYNETGALMLRRERTKKIVYLKEGNPIFVKSNLLSECLGRVLVREKMISEEECENSLTRLQQARDAGEARQQGTVLIEMGCISPHNLVYGLQLQLEAKLFEIFGWADGDFQFNNEVDIPPQAIHLDMSLATIVYEGVRRKFKDSHLRDLLGPFEDSFLGVHDDPLYRFQELALEADERAFISKIDGRKTLREMVSSEIVDDKQARQLLYALLASEMIQPQTRASRSKRETLQVPPRRPSRTPPPLKRKPTSTPEPSAPAELAPLALGDLGVPELRKRLSTRIKAIRRQNYFEMLGVSRLASATEIRRAYMALSRDLHPDQMRATAPADARALAEQIQQQLTTAYETLSDTKARAPYELSLTIPRKAGGDDVGRILSAEAQFRKGEQAVARGVFADAATHFEKAVELYPDEGEFHAHLGWARYRSAPDDNAAQRQAEDDLLRGIAQSPRRDIGYLFLGRMLRETEREAEAVERFETALVCNPDCKEALEALSLIRSSQRRNKSSWPR